MAVLLATILLHYSPPTATAVPVLFIIFGGVFQLIIIN